VRQGCGADRAIAYDGYYNTANNAGTLLTLGLGLRRAGPGRALKPVGSALGSVNDILANPQLLRGMKPAQVEAILKGTPGWKSERLGKGSRKGQGWVFREYTNRDNPTGRMLRWHPGGGHHGSDPYWRVKGNSGDLGGIIPG